MDSAQRPVANEILLEEYRPPTYRTHQLELCVRLDRDRTEVVADLHIHRTEHAAPGQALFLQGEDLEAQGFWLDGQPLPNDRVVVTPEGLTLLDPPEDFTFRSVATIAPSRNTRLEGLYISRGIYCTQCEAEGFRRIIWSQDRPDVLASYRVRVEGDRSEAPTLLSNGNLVESGDLAGGRHFAVFEDPWPKPSYLFALVAGELEEARDTFIRKSGKPVSIRVFVEPGQLDETGHALACVKQAMDWEEKRWGLEYDLDEFSLVAIRDFNFGAMENKGLNVFNAACILAHPDIATDQDYAGIQGIIGHEYFHNWTGNRITCRDWFQLSLKEGLTVFRDQEFSSDMRVRSVKRIEDIANLRSRQFAEDAGPLAHPVRPDRYVEINNFYTSTVYDKGAELLRMQEAILGKATFFKGFQAYIRRFSGQAVTCEDFLSSMERASGRDLSAFMRWYTRAGTPGVKVRGEYDSEKQQYRLSLQQVPSSRTDPKQANEPMLIPFRFALLDGKGEVIPLHIQGPPPGRAWEEVQSGDTQVTAEGLIRQGSDPGGDREPAGAGSYLVELNRNQMHLLIDQVPEPPVPVLNMDLSAPVLVHYAWSDQERALLMRSTLSGSSAFDAAQGWVRDLVLRRASGRPESGEERYLAVCRDILEKRQDYDPAYLALLLSPPTDADMVSASLSSHSDGPGFLVDVPRAGGDLVSVVLTSLVNLRHAMAYELRDLWLDIFHESQVHESYSPEPNQAGRRSLCRIALYFLVHLDGGAKLARDHYYKASNMTERMAAMGALNVLPSMEGPSVALRQVRDDVFEDYDKRFGQNPTAMDKWFGLEGRYSEAEVIKRIRRRTDHPAWSLLEPNKVRALLGAFVTNNPLRFHALDGSGYRLIIEQVTKLNLANPSLGARLLNGMQMAVRLGSQRKESVGKMLEKLCARDDLSPDLREIAERVRAWSVN